MVAFEITVFLVVSAGFAAALLDVHICPYPFQQQLQLTAIAAAAAAACRFCAPLANFSLGKAGSCGTTFRLG